jgi:hypothetical protein
VNKPLQATDTPIPVPTPSRMDRIKAFIGDLARPFALISMSLATSIGVVIVCLRVDDGNDGAIALGAVGLIIGGMYGFKSWENTKASQ